MNIQELALVKTNLDEFLALLITNDLITDPVKALVLQRLFIDTVINNVIKSKDKTNGLL